MTAEDELLLKSIAHDSAKAAAVYQPLFEAMKGLLVCGLIHSEEYGGCNWKPSPVELAIFRAFDIDIGEHV